MPHARAWSSAPSNRLPSASISLATIASNSVQSHRALLAESPPLTVHDPAGSIREPAQACRVSAQVRDSASFRLSSASRHGFAGVTCVALAPVGDGGASVSPLFLVGVT
jgi:hypothetical protein